MVEAHKLTLQFYRQACRLLPALINRQGNSFHLDYHKSKLNMGAWVRKGANIREPMEVTKAIRHAYDFLFHCVYNEMESGYFNRYILTQPTRYDESYLSSFPHSKGLNLMENKKFGNKSNFLRKFVKGVRPLLH
jgi:hypothetical protein